MKGKLSIKGIRVLPADTHSQGTFGNSAEDLKHAAAEYAAHAPGLHVIQFAVEDREGTPGFMEISIERGMLSISAPIALTDKSTEAAGRTPQEE
jgi:hypothetical protein